MKFSVSQASLATALTIVMKGLGNNTTLPVLNGIYIKAEDGVLTFETTDLTIWVKHRVPALVEEPGAVVMSAKLLNNIVKTLPDVPVTFEDSGSTVVLTCERSRFNLNTLSAADFPDFPDIAIENSVELPIDVLGEMVDRVYRVTSKESSRPILGGVLLTVEENLVRLVATDSYRLAVCDTSVETSSLEGEFKMIIPGTAFHNVLSIPSDDSMITIGATPSQVVFTTGDTMYVSRRIEGNFPNYKQLLPESCNTSAVIDLDEFKAALGRVSTMATSSPNVRFDIEADVDLMTLSAASQDSGDGRVELAVEVTGENVVIALNYKYVNDCLNALSSEKEVTLELRDTMQPAIFKSYSKINYLYLLMPVRL
jgi:DNA polymerase-3 subunit beta